MKFLIVAAFVGFCSAVFVPTGRQVLVGDAQNVAIQGLYGNQYVFTHYPTEKYFDIVINGVDTPAKKIHINDQTCHILNLQGFPKAHQVYQHGLVHENVIGGGYLLNVLKQFQGPIGEEQFHDLLQTVQHGVQQNQICHIIYHLLAHLDEQVNEDLIEKYFVQQQQHFGGKFLGQQLYGQQLVGKQWGVLPWVGQYGLTGKQYPVGQQLTHPYVVNPIYQNVWGQQPWNVHHYGQQPWNVPGVYTSGIKSVWGQYPYGYVPQVYQHGVQQQQYPYGYVPSFYQHGVGQQQQQYGQEVIPVY